MKDIEINAAIAADLPAIVGLLFDDPIGNGREATTSDAMPGYAEALKAIIAHPDSVILVARCSGKVIGCVQVNVLINLSYRGAKRAMIEDMRIAQDVRGRGLGRALIDAALAWGTASGCSLAQLFVHEDRAEAHAFYEACGFTWAHRGYRKTL